MCSGSRELINKREEIMLNKLPLNKDKIYVMAETKGGCEVYAPMLSTDNAQDKKKELQEELLNY